MEDGLTHEVLTVQGYRLVDDAWEARGRRTYLHEEDATCGHMMGLAGTLAVLVGKRTRINCGRFVTVVLTTRPGTFSTT